MRVASDEGEEGRSAICRMKISRNCFFLEDSTDVEKNSTDIYSKISDE